MEFESERGWEFDINSNFNNKSVILTFQIYKF